MTTQATPPPPPTPTPAQAQAQAQAQAPTPAQAPQPPALQPLPPRQAGVTVRQLNADLLLVEAAGKKFLTEAECPHRKGRLLFGYVNDRRLRITCPLHHSTFDLTTGEQVSGPVCGSLKVTPLTGERPYPLG